MFTLDQPHVDGPGSRQASAALIGAPSPASTTQAVSGSRAQTTVPSRRKQLWSALRIVALVFLVVVGYKLVRVGYHGWQAYDSGMAILALRADGDFSVEDMQQAQANLSAASAAVAGVEKEMRFFVPVLRGVSFVPYLGPTLAAVPDLLVAGREYAAMADVALRGMLPALQEGGDAPLIERALPALAGDVEGLGLMLAHADAARLAMENIRAEATMPVVAEPLAQAQAASNLLSTALRMAPALPELLGMGAPQTYLLLVQNNHELRATGGFISAVGKVTVANGRVAGIELTDSYNVLRDDVDHPWAPDPMRRYMGIDLVFLRDANWSPDLPTTSQLVKALYNQDAGVEVDGVITIDLRAVELLVGALEPLTVEGAEMPITGENLIEQIKQFWDKPAATGDTIESAGLSEWWKQRKDFMPSLAKAALDRLQSGNVDFLAVAGAAEVALKERAIQVWLENDFAAGLLAETGWDGGLHPSGGGDFLALVDTNMGYNKVDAVLRRGMRYEVTWPEGERGLAKASVTYEHPVQAPGHVCDNRPRYGENYDDMTRRCYFDYVRLYAPGGSELVSVEGVAPDSIANQPGEDGTQVFAGHFVLSPGARHTVVFTYRLPEEIQPEGYRLIVRKQSGVGPLPLEVNAGGRVLMTNVTEGVYTWTPPDQAE